MKTIRLRETQLALGLALLSFVLMVPAAQADLTGALLEVQARTANGSGSMFFTTPVFNEGGSTVWSLPAPVQITDPHTNVVLATLRSARVEYVGDPQVNLDFSMQAGGAPVVFLLRSALMSFPPMTNAEGRASVGINLTDFDGNGATLDPVAPRTGAYLAQYNGFVPNGTTFAEAISHIGVAEPFGSNSASANIPSSGYLAIPGTVSDMSAQVEFQISANDFASGTSNFEIIPEPAALMGAVLGLALLRRRG